MFKTSMAVIDRLQKEIDDLKKNNTLWRNKHDALLEELKDAHDDLRYERRVQSLATEEAKNTIRKEMHKSLVTADVERAQLQGKVEAYDKLMVDTNKMLSLFEKAIAATPKLHIVDTKDIKV